MLMNKATTESSHDTGTRRLFLIMLMVSITIEIGLKLPIVLSNPDIFLGFYDREFNFVVVAILIQEIRHLGVLLWSVADQLPTAYLRIVGGFYSFHDILVAASLTLINAVSSLEDSSKYLYTYETVSLLFYSTIKYLTCYYFLNSFIDRRPAIYGAAIFTALLSTYLNLGMGFKFLYLLSFLVVGSLIRLGKRTETKELGHVVAIAGVVIFTAPLFSFSYFYLGIHCFLLASAAAFLLFERDRIRSTINLGKRIREAVSVKKLLPYLAFAFFINLPYLALYGQINSIEFGLETSRLSVERNFLEYLKLPYGASRLIDLGSVPLDFEHAKWGFSWIFMGTLTIMLVFYALLKSPDRLKWIFAFQALLFAILNGGPKHELPMLFFHIANYLTNPFAFLGRSFHMTGSLMMFLPIMGLVGLALQRLSRPNPATEPPFYREIRVYAVLLVFFVANYTIQHGLKGSLLPYIYVAAPIIFYYLISRFRPSFLRIDVVFLVLLLAIDLPAFIRYQDRVMAHLSEWSERSKSIAESSGLGRNFPSAFFSPFAKTDLQQHADVPLAGADRDHQNEVEIIYSGQALHRAMMKGTIYWPRVYFKPDQYRPKHRSYRALVEDAAFQAAIKKDPGMVRRLPGDSEKFDGIGALIAASPSTGWRLADTTSPTFKATGGNPLSGDIMILLPYDSRFKISAGGTDLQTQPVKDTFIKVSLPNAVSELNVRYDPGNLARIGFPIAVALHLLFWIQFLRQILSGITGRSPISGEQRP